MALSLQDKLELATPGSLWVTSKNRIDTIIGIGNKDVSPERRDKFPLLVTYANDRQSWYTIPLEAFLKVRENKGVDALIEGRLATLFDEPQEQVRASAPAPAAVRGGRVQTEADFLDTVLGGGNDTHDFGADEDEAPASEERFVADLGAGMPTTTEHEEAPSALRLEAEFFQDEGDTRNMPLMDSADYAAMLVSVSQEPIVVASADGSGLESNVMGINLAFRLPREADEADAAIKLLDAAFNPGSVQRTFQGATIRGRNYQWNMFIGVTHTTDLFGDYAVVRVAFQDMELEEVTTEQPVVLEQEPRKMTMREMAAQLAAQAAVQAPAQEPVTIPADPTPLEGLAGDAVTSEQRIEVPADPQPQ